MLSAKLQSLIDKLSNPDTVTRVRLVRETKAVYEDEHPTAAKGKAQAAGANRARAARKAGVAPESGVTPFAEWLAEQLHLGVTTVRNLIARAEWVPEEALQHIESLHVSRVGGLLDDIVALRRRESTADWRLVVLNHISPPEPVEAKKLVLRGDWAFMSRDVRFQLDSTPKRLFDAIITDPPYGMSHVGKVNGVMTDDKYGSTWAVPMMAKWVKPDGAICLWCNGGTLGKWTKAVLDAGLVISALVHWDKGEYLNQRGEEVMLVAGHGFIPTSLRTLSVPTLRGGPERAVHDTPKPLALMEPIIEAFSRPGEWLFDPFAGTGVVGEAALRTGRRYIGAELDPNIADYAITRLKQVDRDLKEKRAA